MHSFSFKECNTLLMSILVKFINSVRSWRSIYDNVHNILLDFFLLLFVCMVNINNVLQWLLYINEVKKQHDNTCSAQAGLILSGAEKWKLISLPRNCITLRWCGVDSSRGNIRNVFYNWPHSITYVRIQLKFLWRGFYLVKKWQKSYM